MDGPLEIPEQMEALRRGLSDIAVYLKDAIAGVENTHALAAGNIATALHAVEGAIQDLTTASEDVPRRDPVRASTGGSVQAETLARAKSELASGEFDMQG